MPDSNVSPLMRPVIDAIITGSRSGYGARIVTPRPNDTTAYTALDVVGGVIRFPNMGPAGGGEVMITSWKFDITETALVSTEGAYFLELYDTRPTSALADNAPWALTAANGDQPFWLGTISLGTPAVKGGWVTVQADIFNRQVTLKTTDLWAYLVTSPGYTPVANTQFILGLHSAAV